jgi:hypothetical protein
MQQSNFIDFPLARHVSRVFAHHQERRPCITAYGVLIQFLLCCWAAIQEAAAWSVCMVWRAVLHVMLFRS